MLRTQAALRLWLAGFGGAAALQALFPELVAQRSSWGYAPGWQREIAIWNGGALAATVLLRRSKGDIDRSLLSAFLLLAAALGTNHVFAALRSPNAFLHWAGAAANAIGLYVAVQGLSQNTEHV